MKKLLKTNCTRIFIGVISAVIFFGLIRYADNLLTSIPGYSDEAPTAKECEDEIFCDLHKYYPEVEKSIGRKPLPNLFRLNEMAESPSPMLPSVVIPKKEEKP